jgi:hypothetical protein
MPRDAHAEFLGSVERPIRVAEHPSGEQNQVGLPVADDLVGLSG